MSDYGIFTYVQGTTLDAINSIDFNYVLDLVMISGVGSKTIDVDTSGGLILSYMIFDQVSLLNKDARVNISLTGKTLSWDVSYQFQVAIIGAYP